MVPRVIDPRVGSRTHRPAEFFANGLGLGFGSIVDDTGGTGLRSGPCTPPGFSLPTGTIGAEGFGVTPVKEVGVVLGEFPGPVLPPGCLLGKTGGCGEDDAVGAPDGVSFGYS